MVERYNPTSDGWYDFSAEGDLVKYEDYKALEGKLDSHRAALNIIGYKVGLFHAEREQSAEIANEIDVVRAVESVVSRLSSAIADKDEAIARMIATERRLDSYREHVIEARNCLVDQDIDAAFAVLATVLKSNGVDVERRGPSVPTNGGETEPIMTLEDAPIQSGKYWPTCPTCHNPIYFGHECE